jgi:glycerol-3-phosphate dehydrogenase (NAD(P)+)
VFAEAGSRVTLWGRDRDVLAAIAQHRENPKYLKGVKLSSELDTHAELDQVIERADIVICSIPTQHIRGLFSFHAAAINGKPIVNTSKGIEMGTRARVSQIFAELTPRSPYAVLSGPSFAEEVARRLPTAVTIAATDKTVAARVQRLCSTSYFRGYTSQDVLGVELCGALKNVIAIASGIVNGLKLGYNAQAAIINRGIAEIARAGMRQGALATTFLGLAGMGDLVLTCTGPLSRNRRVGLLLGEGKTLAEAQRQLEGVAEGVFTSQAAFQLAREWGIEMPILNEIYRILYEDGTPQDALNALMRRDLKEEWDL